MISLYIVEQYLVHLYTVLLHLYDYMLFIKHPKYDFLNTLLYFLGHMISPGEVVPDLCKVAAICNMIVPTYISHLCLFLGCTSLCKRFVPQHAAIYVLLTDLLGLVLSVVGVQRSNRHLILLKLHFFLHLYY